MGALEAEELVEGALLPEVEKGLHILTYMIGPERWKQHCCWSEQGELRARNFGDPGNRQLGTMA